MKHLPLLLGAALGLGALGYTASAFSADTAAATQETQKDVEKSQDKKGEEASDKITVWILDAAGKG